MNYEKIGGSSKNNPWHGLLLFEEAKSKRTALLCMHGGVLYVLFILFPLFAAAERPLDRDFRPLSCLLFIAVAKNRPREEAFSALSKLERHNFRGKKIALVSYRHQV